MIRSMTAFAHHEVKGEQGQVSWSLRSVNHRYLEISIRLPEQFRSIEDKLRKKATSRLGRGKLDGLLNYKPPALLTDQVIINDALVQALVEATHRVESVMNNPARISAIEIMQWPGITLEPEYDTAPLQTTALNAFDHALSELIDGREREGSRLKPLLIQRAEAIFKIVAQVRKRRPQVLAAQKEKLLNRITELKLGPDAQRLEQELAIIAQRLDIEEELDRLDGHCKELTEALKRDEPVGRRLDFLMQEFNREANTLASKAADLQTTQSAVELKVLIEQMREQAQNIE
ncbi:MAG: YicC/YloC family endoribonuclease [Pseudomonadota bacterium]